jgi:tryptophan-rich sensory protein
MIYAMLVLCVGICLGIGAIGGSMTAPAVRSWYPSLKKPAWNPPSWVFAPVWTVLYVAMGTAAWLIWRDGEILGLPGVLFLIQLTLNLAWSWLFFYRKRPDWAFLEVLVLWAFIVATTIAFWRANPIAGELFIPYLAWVSFASVLNGTVWRLNVPNT